MPDWSNAKPIPTLYANHRFRRRLEARWAVFFDAIGWSWLYETEGFDLDGLRYLPDFWIPRLDAWVEIKPDDPTDRERDKASRLAEQTRKTVYILSGLPRSYDEDADSTSCVEFVPSVADDPPIIGIFDEDGLVGCPECGSVAFWLRRVFPCGHVGGFHAKRLQTPRATAILTDAISLARQSRFESR